MFNTTSVTKKEKEMISSAEILDIGYTNSIGFVEIFWNKKKVITSVISTSKSLQTSKFIIFSSMDFKGSDLSWFPLNEPTSYLMSVATHTSTKEIPQVQSQHHYLIPLWNWTKIQNKINGCYFVHFLISYCSKISKALYEVTFCPSTPDSMRWLYLKIHMLLLKKNASVFLDVKLCL